MNKVQLIITGINGSEITATAVVHNEENQYISTSEISYNETDEASDILDILGYNEGWVYEYFVGGRPNRRKK